MKKIRIKRIFNLAIANELLQRGNHLLKTKMSEEGRVIYTFERTKKLEEDFAIIAIRIAKAKSLMAQQ